MADAARTGPEAGEFASSENAADTEDVTGRPGPRRRLGCLAAALLVLVVLAGGTVWLLRDELFHPFGDDRACSGSDQRLPDAITAGGTPIPSDASDLHYYTRNGRAELSFRSGRLSDYLHGAGIVPEGRDLFDERYGSRGVANDTFRLPDGLCGPTLENPVWIYPATHGVSVTVERSPLFGDHLRFPARAVITYTLG
ncbi:hypothetical protein ABZ357_31610 [Streptomyces sp. NPDC005917]|uniref:hypothetical protein n=1 Tax=unclassified Streptomyces TaxID=2593676 RepID=UPI0033E139BE